MSIINFYINDGSDGKGRTLKDILRFSFFEMEHYHNYIQWLFPLAEPSAFLSPDECPVLTRSDANILSHSKVAVDNIIQATRKFNDFLMRDINNWCNNGNHNLLRITRVIRSLRLFGLENESYMFARNIMRIAIRNGINNTTFSFWDKALTEDPFESLAR